MFKQRLWVFRLSLGGYLGKPTKECLTGVDEKNILEYWRKIHPIDYDCNLKLNMDVLKNDLKKGKLRQGWGTEFEEMNLNLNQPIKEWIENYRKLEWRIWGNKVYCDMALGRYNILKKMKEMKFGDIIFVPKIPEENKFTIVTVKKGTYKFEPINGNCGRHGHLIEVEKIKEFNYTNHTFPKITFMPYRKAIDEIKEHHKNYAVIKDFLNRNYK